MIAFNQKITTTHKSVNYFITSDLHFGHSNCLKFTPETRPFENTEEMEEFLVEHWNSLVGVNDVVLHLGDFTFITKDVDRVEKYFKGEHYHE